MKKTETIFACQNCGHQSRKWLGKCPECGEWNSLVEERAPEKKGASRSGFKLREVTAVAYTEIESQDEVRISSGVTEFDRVLGGGIVPGTLVATGSWFGGMFRVPSTYPVATGSDVRSATLRFPCSPLHFPISERLKTKQ